MDAVIGLDIGTTSTKGIVLAENGEVLATHSEPTVLKYPQPGWVELEAIPHYESVVDVLRALSQSVGSRARIRAIAAGAASGNGLLIDEKGIPLSNVISWMDERAVGATEETLPTLEASGVHDIVGWPWGGRFAFAQFAWFRHFHPDLYREAAKLCTNTSYITWRLCGEWATDVSTTTPSYLQHQESGSWHQSHLDMIEAELSQLPGIVDSGTVLGELTPEAVAATGLQPGTEIVAGCFDHPAAARATGTLEPGDLLLSCGTSWVGFLPIRERSASVDLGLLTDPFLTPKGPWAGMTSLSRIGVAIDHYVDTYLAAQLPAGKARFRRFDELAAKLQPGDNDVLLSPLRYLETASPGASVAEGPAPASKDLGTVSPEEIARAVMEGTGFDLRARLETLKARGVDVSQAVMVGGPSESPIWPQIAADILGIPLQLARGQYTGARGAAILAGVGVGIYSRESEVPESFDREITPDPNHMRVYDETYERFGRRYGAAGKGDEK